MYSAYKLNKQGDSIQPWCTYSLPNFEPVHCFMSHSNCCFLTCTQVSQEAGKMVWYSHLFKNFPQFVVIHTVKDFSVVSEAEVDVFLEFCCLFYGPTDVGNLISSSSTFLHTTWTSGSFQFMYCWSLENFEHYFATVWDECNCSVVWAFFGIAFLWDWDKNWPFPVLWPLVRFPNLLAYWM